MKNVYFIGIGGIGMSAIARYFMHEGRKVAGYDRTPSPLTIELEAEGAAVHYADNIELIGEDFRNPATTLVVYTPAIPADHSELCYFRNGGFEVVKRSQVLGHLTEGKFVTAIAGTHGKTSTTTMTAWFTQGATGKGNAFLGGISKNFGSNLVLGGGERIAVEADEFDRSFLTLKPNVAVVTSTDADHLDIYGTHEEMKRAFGQFVERIKAGGTLVAKLGLNIAHNNSQIRTLTYSVDNTAADFYAEGLEALGDGTFRFAIHCPDRTICNLHLGVGGRVNIENAVAAVAAIWSAGEIDEQGLRKAMDSFRGVKRRFECYINTPQRVYIDDYAHHPEELRAAIESIKGMFPARRLTVAFQPHLYTRTRDFHSEFAAALSLADEVVLLPIYPARELPIEGVNSELIGRDITAPWRLVEKSRLADTLAAMEPDVVVTFGAGDIDRECSKVEEKLRIEN
ncbi:MAG: UDP-N-acetylmuramate--L-alanine ligase [Rikenellaceae bacterium]|nr:UDP-N-acetylmuramate--L-alanine ligase [Rikenellaceae bacterium]